MEKCTEDTDLGCFGRWKKAQQLRKRDQAIREKADHAQSDTAIVDSAP